MPSHYSPGVRPVPAPAPGSVEDEGREECRDRKDDARENGPFDFVDPECGKDPPDEPACCDEPEKYNAYDGDKLRHVSTCRLVKHVELVLAPRHLRITRLPQGEGIDGRSRPGSTGLAVAIAHQHRIARDGELHRAAETTALISLLAHLPLPLASANGTSRHRCR